MRLCALPVPPLRCFPLPPSARVAALSRVAPSPWCAPLLRAASVPVWWFSLPRPVPLVFSPRPRPAPAFAASVPVRGRPPPSPLGWGCRWSFSPAAFPPSRPGGPGSRFAPPGGGLRCPVRRLVSAPALFPAAASAGVVAFSGARRLSPVFRPLVAGVVGSALAAGRSVVVGCAGGADAFVRAAAPGAAVFSVAAFGDGRGAFARRSVALVRAAAAGGSGSGLVVFPSAPCPAGLLPSPAPGSCFCGLGSGSWASAAFAAGLGLPVVVFPCGFSSLPPWGAWRPAAAAGVWARGFLLR